jgi:hypothetical protein
LPSAQKIIMWFRPQQSKRQQRKVKLQGNSIHLQGSFPLRWFLYLPTFLHKKYDNSFRTLPKIYSFGSPNYTNIIFSFGSSFSTEVSLKNVSYEYLVTTSRKKAEVKIFSYIIKKIPRFISSKFSPALRPNLGNKSVTHTSGFTRNILKVNRRNIEGRIVNDFQVSTSDFSKNRSSTSGSHWSTKVIVPHHNFVKIIDLFLNKFKCLRNIIGRMICIV